MTAKEFLDVSTKLVSDMQVWVAEVAKTDALSASDLALLNASMKVLERVALKAAAYKPEHAN